MPEKFLFGSSYENGNEDDPPRDRPAPLAAMLALRSIGMNYIRAWNPLDRLNPSPGVFDYSYFDLTASAIKAAGLKLYMSPLWAPEHACEGKRTYRSYTRGVSVIRGGRLEVDRDLPDASTPGRIDPDWARGIANVIGTRWGQLIDFCSDWNETAMETYLPGIHVYTRARAIGEIMEGFVIPFFTELQRLCPHVRFVGPEAAEHGSLHEHLMQEETYATQTNSTTATPLYRDAITFHPYAGWSGITFPQGSHQRIENDFLRVLDSQPHPEGAGLSMAKGRQWIISEFNDHDLNDNSTGLIVPFMREAIRRYRPQGLIGISSHEYKQWFEGGTWENSTFVINQKGRDHQALARDINGAPRRRPSRPST